MKYNLYFNTLFGQTALYLAKQLFALLAHDYRQIYHDK